MSRSRKHHYVAKDHNSKFMKRQASKRVRRATKEDDVTSGSMFKRLLDPWDICDYNSGEYTLEEYIRAWENLCSLRHPEFTMQQVREYLTQQFSKWYIRK